MVDFMILYEVPTREYESIYLLGNELQCRGYSVKYQQIREVSIDNYRNYKWLKRYHNNVRVLLVPSFYHDVEMLKYFYAPFGKVEKIVNLRWEQYYINEVMDNPREHAFLFPNESGKNAYQVCWGDVSHRSMLEVGIEESRLLDTGPMHMDILREEFREYFLGKDELMRPYHLDSSKKTVLFISSFANATDRSSYHKYLDTFFSGKYRIDYSRIELEQLSYEAALIWFDDFMAAHEDVNFVYRPHPSETITDQLKSLEDKYPNFRVITDHSVKQWILACETIVTWMSTAIVEAFFAGKPCFIIRPVQFPQEKDMCIYKGAKFITDEAEFLNITSAVCENSLSEDYIRQCYDVREGEPSYLRLCKELERILASQEMYPWDKKLLWKCDRTKPILALKRFWAVLKNAVKKAGIKILSAFQETTNLSFGKRIDDRLKFHKDIHNKRSEDSFQNIDAVLGSIVRKNREKES